MNSKTLSASLLIAGTAVGAGMLGIPLVTAQSGLLPAIGITLLSWAFMLATGLLYLEATLWMHPGANVLSMSYRFLGKKGRAVSGFVYLFLYYCLMVAYFAAGAPIFLTLLGFSPTGIGYFFYGAFFALVVVFGIKAVDRMNYILIFAMFLSYLALINIGVSEISLERLSYMAPSKTLFAVPVLFSAFGFHNIIPSLSAYFRQDVNVLRKAIFFGTAIPLVIYLVWQWLIIGVLPLSEIELARAEGLPVTEALRAMLNNGKIILVGKFFALFAVLTSMLGVAFSMVDFLADGMQVRADTIWKRSFLCLLVFLPPFLLSSLDPSIFLSAISFAGGFGEAFLNGALPVMMVWVGRYHIELPGKAQLFGRKPMLALLFFISIFVIVLELFALV